MTYPGELPPAWTVAKLKGKHPSQPFNPDVANAFFWAGLIEAGRCGISDTAVENNLRYLQARNFIARLGPAKGGAWQVQAPKA